MEMLMISVVTVYIVDLSGFTEHWRDALARWLKVGKLRPLPPFDCGQCMTWWGCLIYVLCIGEISLWTVAWSALLAFMSTVMGNFLLLLRDMLLGFINKLYNRL